jgi:hemerythrin-like domain-containing protein
MKIEKDITLKEQRVIKKILAQHTNILKHLNKLKNLALKHKLLDVKTKIRFKKEFEKIVKIILAHAKKEDEILFPIYKKYVSDKTIEKILTSKQLVPYIST